MKSFAWITLSAVVLAVPALGADEPLDKVIVKKVEEAAGGAKPSPAAKKPAVEARVSPEARALLDQVTAAYRSIKSIELSGTLTRDTQAAGEKRNHQVSFSSSFAAPNRFKHELKDSSGVDLLMGSTGEKLYAFRPARNDYRQAEAPKDRVATSKFPQPMRSLLTMQNPSLACALLDDAGKYLVEGMAEVARLPDADLDGKKHAALSFKSDKEQYTIYLDPETSIVRRIVLDASKSLAASGVPDVVRDQIVFDYTTINAAAKLDDRQFAWAAPESAREASAGGAMADAGGGEGKDLIGKEAADFTLEDLKGATVKFKDLEGKVVILDFWATWCGPCRASLPGLSKIYEDLNPKGLEVYAIDLEEPREKVQQSVDQLKLKMPVLLDEKSTVSKNYGVHGIPHTVLIGKDGKIAKVFVGSGQEKQIRAAAEAALAQ